MKVSILGTSYTIKFKKYSEDRAFTQDNAGGYCCLSQHLIVVCDMSTFPGWENEPAMACEVMQKAILRHEIVHAFLNESGLTSNSSSTDAWARNEEMVDWFALQGPKIYKIWQKVGAL